MGCTLCIYQGVISHGSLYHGCHFSIPTLEVLCQGRTLVLFIFGGFPSQQWSNPKRHCPLPPPSGLQVLAEPPGPLWPQRRGGYRARPWAPAGASWRVAQSGAFLRSIAVPVFTLRTTRSPSSVLLPTFLGEGSPTTIDARKKGTLIPASLLEDLDKHQHYGGCFPTTGGLSVGGLSATCLTITNGAMVRRKHA